MLFGTDQFSKTGSVAVTPNSTIHAQLIWLVEEMYRGKVKVRQIWLDNQSRFDSVETRKWAADDWVILEFVCPYGHPQGGVQECKNWTVEQTARACMDVCCGHINLLPYAMVHAADTINLWPSEEDEQGKKICPLQKAQDKMPNLKILHVFGCQVMVPVPLGQTSLYTSPNAHLRDRGFEAIYLCSGRPFGKSGILVWDIRSQKIRSVILEGLKYYLNDFPLIFCSYADRSTMLSTRRLRRKLHKYCQSKIEMMKESQEKHCLLRKKCHR
jgi:hypothetical protein